MDIVAGSALIGVIVTGSSGLVWAIRQEGRIAGHDKQFEDKEKLDEVRHEALISRLDRIERKQDASNGYAKDVPYRG